MHKSSVQCLNMFKLREWLLTLRLLTADVSNQQVCFICGNIEQELSAKWIKKNKTLKLVKKDNSDAFSVEQPEELAALLCLRLSWALTSSPSGTCTRVVVYTSVASHSELPQTMPEATACTTQTQCENQKTMLVRSHPMCGIFTTNVKKSSRWTWAKTRN